MKTLSDYILQEGQVWLYSDGDKAQLRYRIIRIERGKVRLLCMEGSAFFRTIDEMELLDRGILTNEFDAN